MPQQCEHILKFSVTEVESEEDKESLSKYLEDLGGNGSRIRSTVKLEINNQGRNSCLTVWRLKSPYCVISTTGRFNSSVCLQKQSQRQDLEA